MSFHQQLVEQILQGVRPERLPRMRQVDGYLLGPAVHVEDQIKALGILLHLARYERDLRRQRLRVDCPPRRYVYRVATRYVRIAVQVTLVIVGTPSAITHDAPPQIS